MSLEKEKPNPNNKVKSAFESVKNQLKKTIQESIKKEGKEIEKTIRSYSNEKGRFSETLIAELKENKITIKFLLEGPDIDIEYSFELDNFKDADLNTAKSTIEITKKTEIYNEKILEKQAGDFKDYFHKGILKIIGEIKINKQ
ncbi:MAG: hypothetical protein GF335_01055 [Candidatus Moranbacteria bacterium]|nr:hypothetical protein [Candidatus Moranbacteria bacterium]